jgi:hypothetical protein
MISINEDIIIDNYPFHNELNLNGLNIVSFKEYNDSVVLTFKEVIDKDNDWQHEVEVWDWMDEFKLIKGVIEQ